MNLMPTSVVAYLFKNLAKTAKKMLSSVNFSHHSSMVGSRFHFPRVILPPPSFFLPLLLPRSPPPTMFPRSLLAPCLLHIVFPPVLGFRSSCGPTGGHNHFCVNHGTIIDPDQISRFLKGRSSCIVCCLRMAFVFKRGMAISILLFCVVPRST